MTEKRKAKQREWYIRNKSSVIARAKKFIKDNPEKRKAYQRTWTQKNTEHIQNYQLKKKYGITLEEQNTMLAKQGNCCAICKTDTPKGRWNKWAVDHCHTSKQVRGMLCDRCNRSLGFFDHNQKLLQRAIEYLKKVKTT